ncbi:hemerythrin domain-containing protein [Asanoa sp. NPDC049518]|uniref:hemerythrin domain-containing protein n=1 Tax=unclassified Asanoa TaxID=2685164 RepID=UPI0034491473
MSRIWAGVGAARCCCATSRARWWSRSWTRLRQVHTHLREALDLTRTATPEGQSGEAATRDLLLYCHGFCAALDAHHRGEEHTLFPTTKATHPELEPVLHHLTQDHSMIAHLLAGLQAALDRAAPVTELERHIEGIAALMENHFRYEER